jgi:hypothetical protein
MERATRFATATFVVVGGLVHLRLWRSGYRGIPTIGPLFALNAAVSAVVAIAVLVRRDVRVQAAAVVLAVSSLAALLASRTVGLLGFTEQAWTDRAVQAVTAELGVIVAVAVAVAGHRAASLTPVRARSAGPTSGRRPPG